MASDDQGISWNSAGRASSCGGSAGGASSCRGRRRAGRCLEDGLEANRAIYGIIVGIHFLKIKVKGWTRGFEFSSLADVKWVLAVARNT